MKIVCIATSFIPSNTANSIQVVKAAHALAALGHSVTLLIPGDHPVEWPVLKEQYGLQQPFAVQWVYENLAFRRYDFAFNAVRKAQQLSPGLIYTWALPAGVLALRRGIPTILELHDRVTGRVGPYLFRRFWRSATPHRLLTNTSALQQVLEETFQIRANPGEIVVAPNGVELERYEALPDPATARATLGIPEGFTAGYTGHFYAGRGMDLMYALARSLPEMQFLWVGGRAKDVAEWQVRLEAEGMKNIILTGFVDNTSLPLYQAAADVLLMPYGTHIAGSGGGNSAAVASPMKMFEYMAAGRAILTSDLPVIHEILNEKMALFCPPEDLSAWEAGLRVLQADPAQRNQLAVAAREAVQAYTWRERASRALSGFLSGQDGMEVI